MEYLKTYEQLQDFYGASNNKIIYTTEDEKWVLCNEKFRRVRIGGDGNSAIPFGDKERVFAFPVEVLEEHADHFLFNSEDEAKYMLITAGKIVDSRGNNGVLVYDINEKNPNFPDFAEVLKQVAELVRDNDHNLSYAKWKAVEYTVGIQKDDMMDI